jgi:hypothetical protein
MHMMHLYIRYYKGVKKQVIENFKNDSKAVLTIKITGGGLGKPNSMLGPGCPFYGHESS